MRRPQTMRPDGSVDVVRIGLKSYLLGDLYHLLRRVTWPRLFAAMAGLWLVTNVVFAGLFLLEPGCIAGARPGHFGDAFFFSVQTLSTIGYGAMSPAGDYANVLVTVEAFLGLIVTATSTGVVFSKFAHPTARVMFAKNALITTFDGRRVLMFRMANARTNQVVEANLRVTLIRDEVTAEGVFMRRFHDLKLERDSSPIFALGWTAFHVIDASSPLLGKTTEDLLEANAALLVLLSGTDDALAASVHARHAYDAQDVLFDHLYVDLVQRRDDGPNVMDYRRFHDTYPVLP